MMWGMIKGLMAIAILLLLLDGIGIYDLASERKTGEGRPAGSCRELLMA